MDFIELVAVMATRYKISIDPKNVAHIRTVRDVAEFVSKSKYADDSTVASF
jgi:acyl carrier protein